MPRLSNAQRAQRERDALEARKNEQMRMEVVRSQPRPPCRGGRARQAPWHCPAAPLRPGADRLARAGRAQGGKAASFADLEAQWQALAAAGAPPPLPRLTLPLLRQATRAAPPPHLAPRRDRRPVAHGRGRRLRRLGRRRGLGRRRRRQGQGRHRDARDEARAAEGRSALPGERARGEAAGHPGARPPGHGAAAPLAAGPCLSVAWASGLSCERPVSLLSPQEALRRENRVAFSTMLAIKAR